MGGYGTYRLAPAVPRPVRRATDVGPPGLGIWVPPGDPTAARDQHVPQLASLRNIPFLIWNAAGDELVPLPGPARRRDELRRPRLPLRFDLRTGRAPHARDPRPVPARGRVPRRRARSTATRAHVTYVAQPDDGLRRRRHVGRPRVLAVGHRAARRRRHAPLGTVDARSRGLRRRRPGAGRDADRRRRARPAATSARSRTRASRRPGARRRRQARADASRSPPRTSRTVTVAPGARASELRRRRCT